MTAVAVIGAGAGGAAGIVELSLAGHEVRWWNRNQATIAPFRDAGGVRYEGVLGEGFAVPAAFLGMKPLGWEILYQLPSSPATSIAAP